MTSSPMNMTSNRRTVSRTARPIARRTVVLLLAVMSSLRMMTATPLAVAAGTNALEGNKTITLIGADGEAIRIGQVEFIPEGEAARIQVKLDGKDFSDEFLSMRPFRCLSRPKQMWCHLAYPYPLHDRVTLEDLRHLEYLLMFLWRPYDKVGVDAWNGLYFKLKPTADGRLVVDLHEADYNVLAVPPEAGVTRPVGHQDLSRAQPGQHSFDRIEIR